MKLNKSSLYCRSSHVNRSMEKLLKMLKKLCLNLTLKTTFLIDILTASTIFSNWVFFNFVSFISSRVFFLTSLENIGTQGWRRDVFLNSNFGSRGTRSEDGGPRGQGPSKIKRSLIATLSGQEYIIKRPIALLLQWASCITPNKSFH